MKTISDTSDSD